MDKIQIAVSREFLWECMQLVYSKWAAEYDALKAVKEEKDDGSTEWDLFHAGRLRNHTEREATWRVLKDEAIALMRSGVMDK